MPNENDPNSQEKDLRRTPQQQRNDEIEAYIAASNARLRELQAKIAARHKAAAARAAAFTQSTAQSPDREAYYKSLRVKAKPELRSPTHASKELPQKFNGNKRGLHKLSPAELKMRLQQALEEKVEKKRGLRKSKPRSPKEEAEIEDYVQQAIRRIRPKFKILFGNDKEEQ